VFVVALLSAVSIALLPKREKEDAALHVPDAGGAAAKR
jgi:hypothetical protein